MFLRECSRWSDLAESEQRLGERILAGDAANVTQELAGLRDKVALAEQAVAAAQRQREAVVRVQQAEQVTRLRTDAAELLARAEEPWMGKKVSACARLELI